MSKWKISLSPVTSNLCPQPFADMARSLRRSVPACFDLRQAKVLIDLAYSDTGCIINDDHFALEVATALEAGGGKVTLSEVR